MAHDADNLLSLSYPTHLGMCMAPKFMYTLDYMTMQEPITCLLIYSAQSTNEVGMEAIRIFNSQDRKLKHIEIS